MFRLTAAWHENVCKPLYVYMMYFYRAPNVEGIFLEEKMLKTLAPGVNFAAPLRNHNVSI